MIKDDPLFDEDLQNVMRHDGVDRCHEASDLIKERRKTAPAPAEPQECMDADWERQDENEHPLLNLIAACIKPTVLFGGLIALCVYWQNAELMDPAAAIPSMMVCATLAGFHIGKLARK